MADGSVPVFLADQFEACLGAIYIDQGYEACDSLLKEVMLPLFKAEKSEDGKRL